VTQDHTPIFTPAALRRIVRQARGVPRVVNTLCTEALMAGCAAHQKPLTAAFVQGVIADSQGGRGRPVWRRSLVPATALALLGGLLWLAPWQGRHDTPSTAPQATRAPGSDRPAKETMAPAAPTVPRQVAEVGPQEGAQGAHSPALRPQPSDTSSEVPAQQPPTNTQTVQESGAGPTMARPTHAEHVDTAARDKRLTGWEATDTTPVPKTSHAKAAKRSGTRASLRVAARHGLPRFAMAPRRLGPVPPRVTERWSAAVPRDRDPSNAQLDPAHAKPPLLRPFFRLVHFVQGRFVRFVRGISPAKLPN
jgi:hypothetical protein